MDNFDHELVADWNNILTWKKSNNPFMTPDWVDAWLSHCTDNETDILTLTMQNKNQTRIDALVNLVLKMVNKPFLGNLFVLESAGNDIACADHFDTISFNDQNVWEYFTDLISIMNETGQAQIDQIVLHGLNENSGIITTIRQQEPKWLEISESAPVPVLTFGDKHDAKYSQGFPKRLRQIFRSLDKDMPNHNFIWNDEKKPIEQVVRDMIILNMKNWEHFGLTSSLCDERMQMFLIDICRRFHDNGWLKLYQMYDDDHLVAAYVVFRLGDTDYFYQCGWDHTYKDFSIGTFMVDYMIRQAFVAGQKKFNFLRGNEAYKYRFGAVDQKQYTVTHALSWKAKLLMVVKDIRKYIRG